MKPKTLILLLVAVSCGLVAMLLVLKARGTQTTENEKFYVAVTDMEPGAKITNIDTQLKEQEFIPGTQPPKALQKADVMAKPDKVLGRVLVRPLARGEAITERHMKDDSIAERLKPGERAVSIPVKMDSSASGFALPGNKVDLVATYNEGNKVISKTFLQNVPILAVNVETSRPEQGSVVQSPTVATLAVRAQDAEKVAWAIKQSQFITMTLRSLTDTVIIKPGAGTTSLEPGKSKEGSQEGSDDEMKQVLVAKVNIKAGSDIINPSELFELKPIAKGQLPVNNDYFSDLKSVESQKDKLQAKVDLIAGEPVSARFLGVPPPLPSEGVVASGGHTMKIFNGERQTTVRHTMRDGVWVHEGSNTTGPTPDQGGAPPSPAPTQPTRPGSEGR